MLRYIISKADKDLTGEVTLFPTKKISNKVLVFRVIKHPSGDQKTLPIKDEVEVMFEKAPKFQKNIDKGEAGAALRHLRSFFNFFKGDWVITGSDKARSNPIKKVVSLLQKQGVSISFNERDGWPPFKLIGKNFKGNTILRVDSSISSQLVAVALILPPTLPDSVIHEMKENIVSSSYIDLTLRALRYLGINSGWDINETLIETRFKDGSELTLESDWSTASYWYEVAALSNKCNITIHGVNVESSQCDIVTKELFYQFGVKTSFVNDGVTLTKCKRTVKNFEYDFSNSPELVPTFAVVCVMLKVPFRIAGVNSLRLKPNDRIVSLQKELSKLGATITTEIVDGNEVLCFNGKTKSSSLKHLSISTFDDHRIAMAFAPIAVTGLPIIIENPMITSKSYPSFWDDFKKVGFSVDQSL